MSQRAPQIPVTDFLPIYREVAEAGGTIHDLTAKLGNGRTVASVQSRMSQIRKQFPKVAILMDKLPLASAGGGGRKKVNEDDLLSIFE